MIIGERLKNARKNKKMTQQELGDKLGVSKVSVCGYEKGSRIPTIDNFVQLLDILEVNADYLLGREIKTVCEDEEEYSVYVAKDDLEIIKELKSYSNLYNSLVSNRSKNEKIVVYLFFF